MLADWTLPLQLLPVEAEVLHVGVSPGLELGEWLRQVKLCNFRLSLLPGHLDHSPLHQVLPLEQQQHLLPHHHWEPGTGANSSVKHHGETTSFQAWGSPLFAQLQPVPALSAEVCSTVVRMRLDKVESTEIRSLI